MNRQQELVLEHTDKLFKDYLNGKRDSEFGEADYTEYGLETYKTINNTLIRFYFKEDEYTEGQDGWLFYQKAPLSIDELNRLMVLRIY